MKVVNFVKNHFIKSHKVDWKSTSCQNYLRSFLPIGNLLTKWWFFKHFFNYIAFDKVIFDEVSVSRMGGSSRVSVRASALSFSFSFIWLTHSYLTTTTTNMFESLLRSLQWINLISFKNCHLQWNTRVAFNN
jgi:hypothetical protein